MEVSKTPYLFTSESLVHLVDITTSIKTKIAIIVAVGPRLTDPRAKIEYFVSLFRFAEEKQIVEDVLKNRAQAISATLFSKSPLIGITNRYFLLLFGHYTCHTIALNLT